MNFDRLARPYRWLEWLAFGRELHRCRTAFLPRLSGCRRVLIVGEGDGRLLSDFLRANTVATVDVIDASPGMLRLAAARVAHDPRVRFVAADARHADPPGVGYDLVVTNFVLDCFGPEDQRRVIERIVPRTADDASWVEGDFRLPPCGWRRLRARAWLAVMYVFFRLTAGVPARRLHDPAALLARHGYAVAAELRSGRGLLSARLWEQ